MNFMTTLHARVDRNTAQAVNQVAALPYRCVGERVEVLLITSRRGKRWIIPKGHIEANLTPGQSAAKEAWEEAGACGKMLGEPVGSYHYRKLSQDYRVEVYPMRVHELQKDWPEADARQRRWERLDRAVGLVHPRQLATLIRQVGEHLI